MYNRTTWTMAVVLAIGLAARAQAGDDTTRHGTPSVLFDHRSPYERVMVVDIGGRRSLRFGTVFGDEQSVLDLADPETPVLEYVPLTLAGAALAKKLERALVVGFGGGTVTRYWRGRYPDLHVDSVDIDPVVVATAFLFFRFEPGPRTPVHVMDGRAFVRSSGGQYDLVLLDEFGAGDAPYHLTTLEFYREIQGKLADGGVVLANLVAEANDTLFDQERTFREAFATVIRLHTASDGNILLVGTAAPAIGDDELARRLDEVAASVAPEVDLARLAQPHPAPGPVAGATVLHDR